MPLQPWPLPLKGSLHCSPASRIPAQDTTAHFLVSFFNQPGETWGNESKSSGQLLRAVNNSSKIHHNNICTETCSKGSPQNNLAHFWWAFVLEKERLGVLSCHYISRCSSRVNSQRCHPSLGLFSLTSTPQVYNAKTTFSFWQWGWKNISTNLHHHVRNSASSFWRDSTWNRTANT